ncbi:MAG TPA: hypothetical protein VEA35_10970 [Ramlibacter sp.]|nr:hypothetical protein [Ramlibacter sp.]
MKKQRAAANGQGGGPKGNSAPNRRSGQGAGSALREMLRRERANPRPLTPPSGQADGGREHCKDK